jgi:uncharacterized membrane protein
MYTYPMGLFNTKRLKEGYRLGLFIKGFDGAVETAAGLFLLIIPQADLHGLLTNWTTALTNSSHDVIGHWLKHLDARLSHGIALFIALYLLAHGLIKIVMAVALIKEKPWAFPPSIFILFAFLVYQIYQIGATRSISLILLTILDAVILGLVIWDYQRLRQAKAGGYTNK